MIRALASRLQERAFAGLKPSTLRILDRVADGRAAVGLQRAPKRRASAGTVLIRQWRGVSHRVTVLDIDVAYRGRRYKSLSEVARVITGTRLVGTPVFRPRGARQGRDRWLIPSPDGTRPCADLADVNGIGEQLVKGTARERLPTRADAVLGYSDLRAEAAPVEIIFEKSNAAESPVAPEDLPHALAIVKANGAAATEGYRRIGHYTRSVRR